jgi:hypothetical protein
MFPCDGRRDGRYRTAPRLIFSALRIRGRIEERQLGPADHLSSARWIGEFAVGYLHHWHGD